MPVKLIPPERDANLAVQISSRAASDRKRPILIAHRGSSRAAPENTLLSFEAAAREGAQVFECDIRFTQDGEPFVFHDSTLFGILGFPYPVKFLTWTAIRKLCSSRGYQLLHLKDVFPLLRASSIDCYLHLKEAPPDRVAVMIKMIKDARLFQRIWFVFSTSHYRRIHNLLAEEVAKRTILGITYPFLRLCHFLRWPNVSRIALFAPFHLIYFDRATRLALIPKAINRAKSYGMHVTVGFADDAFTADWLLNCQLDGIWSHRPQLIHQILAEKTT